MLPLAFAIMSAILAEVVFEMRHPLKISGRGWIWMARGIHVVSFFILAALFTSLILSYV